MQLPIYLDYMATTPIDPRVAEQMRPYLFDQFQLFGNAATQHFYGQQAKQAIHHATTVIASLLHVTPASLVWTSGATESNNLAIKGAANFYQRQGRHLITCKTEHKSVLESYRYLETQGFIVSYLTPNSDGSLDLAQLAAALRPDTILVSLMHVNNELGTIYDIAAIGQLTRTHGALLHVDATQSIGKIALNLQQLPIDLLSFSAHKIYGPKGIGALYIRQHPRVQLTPQIHGGTQQSQLRAGTLPTHQIIGFAAAVELAYQEMVSENQRLLLFRNQLWQQLSQIPGIVLNGSLTDRIANNLNFSFEDLDGELLQAALHRLAFSTAAACNQITLPSSHVLQALGKTPQQILNSIRLSLGRFTTSTEIDFIATEIQQVVAKLRAGETQL